MDGKEGKKGRNHLVVDGSPVATISDNSEAVSV
jgi:hypothetical protein